MAVRLVLAEDNLLVREGLQQLLTGADGLEVVAVCGDLESLERAIGEQQPDVVVTDIRMPPTRTDEGIQVAERLRESHPDIGVVVLS
jgi:DNA-binding NarL/FixJ family response regulator